MTRQDYGVYIGRTETVTDDCRCEDPALDELKKASAQMANIFG